MIELKNIDVNPVRIKQNIRLLGHIGLHQDGGLDRYFGSQADIDARAWLKKMWEEALRLPVEIDAAANMRVTLSGTEELRPIAIGSHHDTVKNGGKYDGAMGVLLATEVVQRLIEEKVTMRHPICVLAFTGEEPNPFDVSTFGSKIASGKLGKHHLRDTVSQIDSQPIQQALRNAGGDFDRLDEAVLSEKDMAAFIECHLEQGRILYDRHLSLGVVERITGIYREKIHIIGVANHAGTTIMSDRRDAFLAACEVSLAIEKIAKDMAKKTVVATIGRIGIEPNSPNIIPGGAELVLDLRTPVQSEQEAFLEKLSAAILKISKDRDVDIMRNVILNQPAVAMNPSVIAALQRASALLPEETIDMISMAGHDAAHMASVTKAGMLFVNTTDGKSHCAQEYVKIEDIVKAGNVLLRAVQILDEELDS